MITLYLTNIALIALSLGSAVFGVYLIILLNTLDFVPYMTPLFSILLGVTLITFAVFSLAKSLVIFQYFNVLMKRIANWHKEMLYGQEQLPVKLNPYSKKLVRTALYSAAAFVSLLVVTYLVGVISAGDFQFWHEWNWFV